MTEPQDTSYDETPYASQAFPQTHPDRLATMAKLFGMAPAPLDRCRVLELGCASGGNLLPMAAQMPAASFLGIDLSARQIDDGKAAIAELGLTNIELRHLGILDVDATFGKFDYIIAHGVYSWVPPDVQDKILAICRDNLAPHGVAYVSYNTYPGWRMRGMIRDMMLYHSNRFRETAQRVQQARAILNFLAENVPTEDNPYGILLNRELAMLSKQSDSYLLHEFLEHVNEPLYFHQFAQQADAHGLQYLAEADFHTMLASNFPKRVTETLRNIAPEIVSMEQYMDFVRNRPFRQTLLVQKNVPLNRNLNWRHLQDMHVESAARPVSAAPDVRSAAVEQFRAPSGATLSTPNPIVKAAMVLLGERWPAAVPFADLCATARSRLEVGPVAVPDEAALARDRELLGAELLQCYAASLVAMRVHTPTFAKEVAARPRASAMTRLEAMRGSRVTSLRHEPVNLDEFSRHLLQHLDGQRDRSALLDILAKLVADGVLSIQQKEQPVTDPVAIRAILGQALDKSLPQLATAALLEA